MHIRCINKQKTHRETHTMERERVTLITQKNTKPKNPKTEQQNKTKYQIPKTQVEAEAEGAQRRHTYVRMCRALGLFCGATFMHSCTLEVPQGRAQSVLPTAGGSIQNRLQTTDYRPETRDDYGKLHNLNTQGNNNNRNAAKYSSNCSYNNNKNNNG